MLEKNKTHYAWWMLLACCLIQGASLGLVNNCAGIYFASVSADLGVSTGDFSLHLTLRTLISCLGLLVAKRVLLRLPLRVLMTLAACFVGLPMMLLTFADKLWHWYLAGALQGVGMTYLCHFLPSILLPNWFRKKLGFAVGLSSSFAGAVGAVMSWVLAEIIDQISWRAAYLVSGGVFLLMTLPVSLFVVYYAPEELGLTAYGADETEISVNARHSAENGFGREKLPFVVMLVVAIIARAICGMNSHLSMFGETVPMVIVDAAFLTTCVMLGNMILKLIFGVTDDRAGPEKTSYAVMAAITAGVLLMLTGQQVPVCVGAFLFGAGSMFSSVQLPILVQSLWRKEAYIDTFTLINMVSNLFYSLALSLFGYVYDWTGSYDLCFYGVLISAAAAVGGVFWLYRKKPA